MIKELVNFTQNLKDDFKNLAVQSKEGLHIMMTLQENEQVWSLNENPIHFEMYSKKMSEESEFITKCKFLTHNAWCIDTNKCFDTPTKAIHSCSPFVIAFKREHVEGGGKFIENEKNKKPQIYERFENYFNKAFALFDESKKYDVFKFFFTSRKYEEILHQISIQFDAKRKELLLQQDELKAFSKEEKDKTKKEQLTNAINEINAELLKVKALDDSDYLIFYLDESLQKYQIPHGKYLADKLFNTDKYNTEPNEKGEIFGTSNFMNSFNSNMPFLTHQTASFDITGRISNIEARNLSQFLDVLKGKILPNPLPIFIFKEELNKDCITLFEEEKFKIGYQEIIEKLYQTHSNDLNNYYLLNWANTKDGIVFNDFDYVSKFEYEFLIEIEDLFDCKYQHKLNSIFEFQNEILPIIFNNNLIVKTKESKLILKYFDEIDAKYCKSALNHILILKYRKAFYDFVYKSKREAISSEMFHDIMQVSILEDVRLDEIKNKNHTEYFTIRKKLNIWFSLYEKFNQNYNPNEKSMASKLKEYQEFVIQLSMGKAELTEVNDKQFAFAIGQVIEYVLKKSASENNSYQLLESYLQKSTCSDLKIALALDIKRYKHAIERTETRFKSVCDFVLTYETDVNNMKELLPELLAGIFSKNQFFHKDNN